MISREEQVAEKIHAYTSPRLKPYSRVKDLVDLALLIGSGDLNEARLLDALQVDVRQAQDSRATICVVAPGGGVANSVRSGCAEGVVSTDLALVFAQVREYPGIGIFEEPR